MRGKVLHYKGQHLRRAVVPFQTYLGKLPADFRGKGINKAFNHKSQIIHLKISGMLACGLSALILTVSNLSYSHLQNSSLNISCRLTTKYLMVWEHNTGF